MTHPTDRRPLDDRPFPARPRRGGPRATTVAFGIAWAAVALAWTPQNTLGQSTRVNVRSLAVSAPGPTFSIGADTRGSTSSSTVLRFYFLHLANLDKAADEQEKLGNVPQADAWRTHEERASGLTEGEISIVRELAYECNRVIKEEDERFVAALDRNRQSPGIKAPLAEKDGAPDPPPGDRTHILKGYRDSLRARIGPAAFEKLDAYLRSTFQPGVNTVAVLRSPAIGGGTPSAQQDFGFVDVATFTTIEGGQGLAECDTDMDTNFNGTAAFYRGVSANCGVFHLDANQYYGTFECPGTNAASNPSADCANRTFPVLVGHSYRTDADHFLHLKQTCSDPILGNGYDDPLGYTNLATQAFLGSGTVFALGTTQRCVYGSEENRIASTYGIGVTVGSLSISPPGVEVLPETTQTFNVIASPSTLLPVEWSLENELGTFTRIQSTGPSSATFIAPTNKELRDRGLTSALITIKACSTTSPGQCGITKVSVPRIDITVSGTTPFLATAAAGQMLQATVIGPSTSSLQVTWPTATSPPVGTLLDFGLNTARYTAPNPAITDVTRTTVRGVCLKQIPTICQETAAELQLELVPPVAIASVSSVPAGFPAGHETPDSVAVTINGTGFGTSPLVFISDPSIGFTQTSASNTQITGRASIPATSRGGVQIKVRTVTDGLTTEGAASVTIGAATFTVIVSPKTATVRESETQQFGAGVFCRRTDLTECPVYQGVIWSATAGSIDATGLYRAPSSGTIPPGATVTACAFVSPTVCSTATVTLAPISVAVSPATATIKGCPQSKTFTATVANASSQGVTWSIGAGGGSVNALGVYTGPCPLTARGTVTVKACSTIDPARCGTATVTLTPTWTLSVASFAPLSGVTINVSPNDTAGLGSAATAFTRIYDDGATVVLTAPQAPPPPNDANTFYFWNGCDSVSGTACNVTMTQNKTVTVNYQPPRAPIFPSLRLTRLREIGPKTVISTVTLSAAAPAGGATVSLSSSDPIATVPATVLVAAGATVSASFNITLGATTSSKSVTFTTTYQGNSTTTTLTVDAPLVITSFTPSATTVTVGTTLSVTLVATGSAAPLRWAPFRLLSGASAWIPSPSPPYSGVVYQNNATAWTWTPTLADVGTWTITAWARGSDSSRWGAWGNAEVGAGNAGQPPNLTITVTAPPLFEGYFDNLDCNNISGWAWDKNKPNVSINVDIVVDGTPIVYGVPASIYRPDLLAAGKGNGVHGFGYPLPARFRDSLSHSVAVYYSGSVPPTQLGWSPRTISCASTIQVTSATYGASCGAPAGNATSSVAPACNGLTSCSYTVKYQTLGDPAPGCAKDFRTSWTCSGGTTPAPVVAPAEAGFGSVVTLRCP